MGLLNTTSGIDGKIASGTSKVATSSGISGKTTIGSNISPRGSTASSGATTAGKVSSGTVSSSTLSRSGSGSGSSSSTPVSSSGSSGISARSVSSGSTASSAVSSATSASKGYASGEVLSGTSTSSSTPGKVSFGAPSSGVVPIDAETFEPMQKSDTRTTTQINGDDNKVISSTSKTTPTSQQGDSKYSIAPWESDDGSYQTKKIEGGLTIETNYDRNGNVLSTVTKDDKGNITNIDTNNGSALSSTKVTIDGNTPGNDDGSWQTTQTNPDKSTIERNYDRDGNLLSTVQRDSHGNIIGVDTNSGSGLDRVVMTGKDENGYSTLQYSEKDGVFTERKYDKDGKLVSEEKKDIYGNPVGSTSTGDNGTAGGNAAGSSGSSGSSGGYGGGAGSGSAGSAGGISGGTGSMGNAGNTQTSGTVKMDEEGINNIINRIRKAAENLDNYWGYIKNNSMEKVKNSWVADETKTYVDSVLAEDRSVKRIIDSLLLLANTYEQVRNQGTTTQQENAKYIQTNF